MKEKIINLIADTLQVERSLITEKTQVEDIPEWDSLMHIMIIGALEEIGVSIPLEEAIELSGVADILKKAGLE